MPLKPRRASVSNSLSFHGGSGSADSPKNSNRKLQIEFISHELKTPLSCSLMFLQVLQSMALPDEALKYVKLIYCQTNLLMNLVCDFQDMNLDTAGMLQPKICDFDPRQVF